MKRPSQEVIKAFAICNKQLPAIEGWLTEWRDQEMSLLPLVVENTALAQGRCQVLNELCKFIIESPDIVQHSLDR